MITNIIRTAAMASIGLCALVAVTPAFAASVFQTATAVSGGSGDYPISSDSITGGGDGTDAGSNFIGTTFALTGSSSALQFGGNFDAFGNGSIFAEVVSVGSLSSLPTVTGSGSNPLIAWLQANNLGEVNISAPTSAGDASGVIHFSAPLAAGNYAVILGSGLYGTNNVYSVFGTQATGSVNLTSGNTTVGSPNVFLSNGADSFQKYGYDTGIRIFGATPVPLPAAAWLLFSGLSAALCFTRRRKTDMVLAEQLAGSDGRVMLRALRASYNGNTQASQA